MESVSLKFGIRKSYQIKFRSDFGHFGWGFGFKTSQFQNFSIFCMTFIRYQKKISIEEKNRIQYWKKLVWEKYRIRYRKQLGIGKVLDLVSFRFYVSSHCQKGDFNWKVRKGWRRSTAVRCLAIMCMYLVPLLNGSEMLHCWKCRAGETLGKCLGVTGACSGPAPQCPTSSPD